MTTTSSSSRSSGALDDSTRAMARLVTVSFGSANVSIISVVHAEPSRIHYTLGAEWLLHQSMIRHPYPDLTGAAGNEDDRDRSSRTNRLDGRDSATRPQLDVGGNQIGTLACGRRDRFVGRDGHVERSEAAIAQGVLYRHGNQGFVFDDECMHPGEIGRASCRERG